MIWPAIWFMLGFLCGLIVCAFAVIAVESARIGRPPRGMP